MNAQAESPRESVLDALACLLALDRGDLQSADLMLRSYADEPMQLVNAIVAVALCSVRYSAFRAGTTAESILSGVAEEVRSS